MRLPPKTWRFDADADYTQIVRAAATLMNAWRTCPDERTLEAMALATRMLERELDAAASKVIIETL